MTSTITIFSTGITFDKVAPREVQDRDVPHTCSCESFEDRSGEWFHVNSRLSQSLLLEEIRVFQACAVVEKKTGGTSQNGEPVCFQSRGWLLSAPRRSCGALSFAQLRGCAHDARCLSFSSQL